MLSFRLKSLPATLFLALSLAPIEGRAASPEPVKAEHGMVVTAQHLASDVGVAVLKSGGNAVDAAVAVGYALAVTYPTAGNIGGGGFMTIRFKDGKTTFLDFRERAPQAATKTMYLDDKGDVVKGLSTEGYLAVGVPGPVMGFEVARSRYGTKPLAELIAPAIALAKDGFVLEQGDIDSFDGETDRLAKDPAAAAIFLKDGKPFVVGEKLVQTDLAASLSSIAEKGTDAFYKGAIADAIVKASAEKGGILAKADFERYAVRELEAEAQKEVDQKKRELADLKLQLESLLYTSERALAEYGHLLGQMDREAVAGEVTQSKRALEVGSADDLRQAQGRLEQVAQKIGEAMYSQAGGQGGEE